MSDPIPKQTLSVSQKEISERDPTFRILPDGGQPYTVLLVQRTLNIGSEARQDIAIQVAGIAARHARLLQEGSAYRIYDLTEFNGVLVNNQPIEGSRLLRDGDVIRLQDSSGRGATLAYSNPVERALGTDSVGRSYPFEKFPFTIGRDPTSDVALESLAVSWKHATITEQGGAHILIDNNSENGTFVNDRKISAAYRLRPEDVIRVDQVLLVYKGKGLMRLAATQRFEIDGVNLEMTYHTGFPRRALNTMRDVSIAVQPKEFVAIIGGSGSGKSTLLRALNGANHATGGQVLINGMNLYENYELFQPIIGYVPQTDIVQDSLSIYQTLYYGARLRFPNEPEDSREQRISRALEALELSDFRDRLVGRLSGGQKKRVSIALELMAEPGILFLDEPSSGLDPGLDKQLMDTLRRLADRGHIVIVVTHTTLNIDLCDKLALMARGYLAYYGPPKEALTFFGARDYSEIYNRVQQSPESLLKAGGETMFLAPGASQAVTTKGKEAISPGEAARLWAEKYKKTPLYQKYVAEPIQRVQPQAQPTQTAGQGQGQTPSKPADSALSNRRLRGARRGTFLQQAHVLTERTIALVRRDMRTIISMLLVLPLVGLFLGLISLDPIENTRGQMLVSRGQPEDYLVLYDKLRLDPVPTLEQPQATPTPSENTGGSGARRGANIGSQIVAIGMFTPASDAQRLLFMVALAVTLFGIFASAYTIVAEKSLFLRERMVNLRIPPYLASKVVVYSGLAMISCLLLIVTVSLGVRLPDQGAITWGPLEIFITMALTAIAGVSIGILLSALNKQVNAVTYAVLGVLFVQILFAGVLFKMDGPVLETLSRLTVTRWSLEALGATANMVERNAEGRIVTGSRPVRDGRVLEAAPLGRQYFPAPPALSVTYPTTAGDLWVRWGALVAFSLVFLLLSTLALNRSESF